jgi:hypothetical protein
MIWHYDHRAASVKVNPENPYRQASAESVGVDQHRVPNFFPSPQFYVPMHEVNFSKGLQWLLAFRDVTNPTDRSTFVSCLVPYCGLGNTIG